MRKITSFIFQSLNGFYKGAGEDISWHIHSDEGNDYSEKELEADNILLFGSVTYEMMYSFWPAKTAYEHFPVVAERMNSSEKIVLSNSLKKAEWNNTTIISGDTVQKIRELKSTEGKDITILGSGKVVSSLTDAGLIDEYKIMTDPVALGEGTSVFSGIKNILDLKFKSINTFSKSGVIVITYQRS
ncbi:MAG: dihydrofolate reductase family protein [Ignavibacteria bacterium]|nr:dihydrofolate reductase family protein [Ignavibacteria bacterium]